MAEGTAKAHLNTVFRVLGVRTRVEAILRARELGMI
jgi:DNA-binding CsgD family transcriptional regulator